MGLSSRRVRASAWHSREWWDQCYQTPVMQSMGYAVVSGMTLTTGVIWLVARRRFGP